MARQFGIAFDLAEELRPIYAQFGHALPEVNGTDDWTLPMPATYVIGQDRMIRFAFVDPDYRNRIAPAQILATLRALPMRVAA